ncbi:MAG: hypothetical protein RR848_04500, partial [Oscillospiraceae bacterium]
LLHFEGTFVYNAIALQKSNGRSRATAPTEGVKCSCSAITPSESPYNLRGIVGNIYHIFSVLFAIMGL